MGRRKNNTEASRDELPMEEAQDMEALKDRVEKREGELVEVEDLLKKKSDELEQKDAELAEREQALDKRQAELDHQAELLEQKAVGVDEKLQLLAEREKGEPRGKVRAIKVRTRTGRPFIRAGIEFGAEDKYITVTELPLHKLQAIRNEAQLKVEDVLV